jgi:hypothetical protein
MRTLRHKPVVRDEKKPEGPRRALKTKTDREMIERALEIVAADKRLAVHLRRLGGRLTLRKIFC